MHIRTYIHTHMYIYTCMHTYVHIRVCVLDVSPTWPQKQAYAMILSLDNERTRNTHVQPPSAISQRTTQFATSNHTEQADHFSDLTNQAMGAGSHFDHATRAFKTNSQHHYTVNVFWLETVRVHRCTNGPTAHLHASIARAGNHNVICSQSTKDSEESNCASELLRRGTTRHTLVSV